MYKRTRAATQQWLPRILVLLLVASLAGCGRTSTPQPTPTLSPTATPVVEPTLTPPPTPTLEPTTVPSPTATPVVEPTLAPPPTPTLEPTPIPPPEAPVIEPADEVTVEAGKKIAIRASAAGADRYEWELLGDGEIPDSTKPAIIYTAPEEGDTIAIVTVTAYNDQGASPPTSLIINVPAKATASVRLDTLAIPAGWMSGRGGPESFTSLGASPIGCHTDSDCLQVTYNPGGAWGGIFWWPLSCGESGTPDAWDRVTGGTCGINVLEVGNLSVVNRLTFWARGDQGGEVVEFKIGAVDVLPSPGRSLGKVTLTRTWKQHEIDLEGMDLTNAIGLFLWVATDLDNPEGAVFYLDDIQFEGVRKAQ